MIKRAPNSQPRGGPQGPFMMMPQQQPHMTADGQLDDSTEVAQKIESVINMFPLPTEEQLEQFKEL